MEQVLERLELSSRMDVWSSSLGKIEIADDSKRAILIIPLMHFGPNKKGLYWTKEMLEKMAPMFRSVTYRYDLNGQEGSSHTVEKLSSPHFDVGWTYSDEEGAWYDNKDKTLWVKGEVTHPQVIEKLKRSTTDGKREVNFASMGVVVEHAICSICGNEYGTCEHERLKEYDGHLCYKVPTEVSKALHVALTNDPADGEAEIKSCIFQELGSDNMNMAPLDTQQPYNQFTSKPHPNQIPGGLAPSSPQTAQPGSAPSPEMVLRDLAERIKTIEQKIAEKAMQEGTPELVNSAPQNQFMQDNMGTTEQFDMEEPKMEVKAGQATNAQTPVNPPAKKAEMQEMPQVATAQAPVDPMQQIMQMLQQILQHLNKGPETQDANSLINTTKGQFKNADENMATEHMAPGDAVGNSESEGNKKNKEYMLEPGKVATADMSKEFADMKAEIKALRSKLEIQDNDVPEFGGANHQRQNVEVADMTADERAKKFGDFGKFDAIFNGASSAKRYSK
jgi:hypothetical protein